MREVEAEGVQVATLEVEVDEALEVAGVEEALEVAAVLERGSEKMLFR
jgi:hypothetical protein